MTQEPYPPIQPYDTRRISVGGGHSIYVEQCGNPTGIPAVVLHGGPGSGCQASHRQWFDPNVFRVILFDQRGAGRSTPVGSLEQNTTWDLVADIEQIRAELGINRWMVVGGSWGVTLGLAYAQAHPKTVTGLVLRAIFLGTSEELTWAFVHGPQTLRPDLWNALLQSMPKEDWNDPVGGLTRRMHGEDPVDQDRAAQIWGSYERTLSELKSDPPIPTALTQNPPANQSVPNTPRFESHYFRNECFLEPGQLLRDAATLAGIPGIIVQGRYDLLCPPRTANALAAAWQGSELRLVEGAGHAVSEPGIREALVAAIADMGRTLA